MKRALLRDVVQYGMSDAVLKLVAFFTFPLFANRLSVAEYGVMSLVATISGLIALFINMGVNNAVQRFYFDAGTRENDRPRLVSTGLVMLASSGIGFTACFLVGFYVLRDLLATRFDILWLYVPLSLLSNIPLQITQYANDTIRLHFKPMRFAILSFVNNLSSTVLAFVFLSAGKGLTGYFLGFLIAPTVFVPLALVLIKKDLVVAFDRGMAREIFRYGFPFVFAGLGYWLFGSIDRWLLGIYSTTAEVGVYSVAFKFSSVIYFMNSAFSKAWSPIAIKMMTDHPLEYRSSFARILNILFGAMTIVGSGIALFTYEFLMFTSPASYLPAASSSAVIVAALVLNGTTQVTLLGISISLKTNWMTVAVWVSTAVNIGLNLLLIPRAGAMGASVAILVTYFVLTILYAVIGQREHPLPFEYGKLAVILCCLGSAVGLALVLNAGTWRWYYAVLKLAYLLAVSGLFLLTGVIRVGDVMTLLRKE